MRPRIIVMRGRFFLTLEPPMATIHYSHFLDAVGGWKGVVVFPFFDPRAPDLVLGLAIGLSLALALHWVSWTIH